MPQKFPSQQYVASLHFSSGNFCLPFSFGNPLLLPGVGQHCGQHMQLTICSIWTPSTHFTHRSPSRNLKSFSICDETGNEQGFQYQRQTIISVDHYFLAWKKLLNWEFLFAKKLHKCSCWGDAWPNLCQCRQKSVVRDKWNNLGEGDGDDDDGGDDNGGGGDDVDYDGAFAPWYFNLCDADRS